MRPEEKIPRRNRNKKRALTAAEITALLDAAETEREHIALRLGLSVGLRVSEASGIRPGDIDLERGVIRIWDEKKDIWREVIPDDQTLAIVRRYLAGSPPAKYLFPGEGGSAPVSDKTLERIIQRASLQALGEPLSWHSLRHTYLARCQELGVPMGIAALNTGNSPETILKYYALIPRETVRRILNEKQVIPGGAY